MRRRRNNVGEFLNEDEKRKKGEEERTLIGENND